MPRCERRTREARIAQIGIDAAMGVLLRMTQLNRPPVTSPMIAPRVVSVAASTRNCQRIIPRVAPSAFRTPISRVRSVTLIIMIASAGSKHAARDVPGELSITK